MSDYQQRLTAARDAVVEAAKVYVQTPPANLLLVDRKERELRAAVAHLLEVESERAVASAKKEVGGE